MLITFEGGEGAGKTSAIPEIGKWLKYQFGLACRIVREPGGTRIGDNLRALLHEITDEEMDYKTEALLYQASRAEIVAKIIRPAIEAGEVIVMDRFFDSSRVYQSVGRGLRMEDIDWLNNFSTGGITPDLTLLFDLDPVIGLQRRMGNNVEMNRMDKQAIDFYRKVRQGYLELAQKNDGDRWRIINAEQSIESVLGDVKREIENKLISSGFIERPTLGKER